MSNIYTSDVLQEIRSGSEWVLKNEDLSTIRWLKDSTDGKGIPTEEEVEEKRLVMQAEYDANQYQRDRQYPTWQEQMDMQYHDELNGTTTWKDAVAKVKADHPKG